MFQVRERFSPLTRTTDPFRDYTRCLAVNQVAIYQLDVLDRNGELLQPVTWALLTIGLASLGARRLVQRRKSR